MYCQIQTDVKKKSLFYPTDIPVFLDSSGRNLDERKTLESWEPFLCITSLFFLWPGSYVAYLNLL